MSDVMRAVSVLCCAMAARRVLRRINIAHWSLPRHGQRGEKSALCTFACLQGMIDALAIHEGIAQLIFDHWITNTRCGYAATFAADW
jgi:hypothetical protein